MPIRMPGPKIYNDGWCARCGNAPRAPHHAYCRVCRNDYTRTYRQKRYKTDPDYRRRARACVRRSLYGITEERYTELWAQQGGVCAICLLGNEGKDLGVDHVHETGAIRGLLCDNCNGAIGMLKERPDLLHRAVDYVEN
jgi:hypothetical protein